MGIEVMESCGEKCGVFGVYGDGLAAARLVHPGLWALQHRGQESSGIAASDGEKIRIHKGMGLVAGVFREEIVDSLPGYSAIGHNRYGTSGGSLMMHAQPVWREGGLVAVAHNGNLPSTEQLHTFLRDRGVATDEHNDSEMMAGAIDWYVQNGASLEEAIIDSYPLFTGAFSLVAMTVDKMAAVRDPYGIRPLSIGRANGGVVFSSETCGIDAIVAEHDRDVRPGEMVVVDEQGMTSYQVANGHQRLDIFEFVYFAHPVSVMLGERVNEVRRRMGIRLAQEHPVAADVVIPVPDSAIPAALGFARESNILFDHGLIKNRYIQRTFIRPDQRLREKDVEMKLKPLPEVIGGKRVVIVDDSIVRGTTSARIVDMVRRAGAREVHLRIPSPPVLYPDFYGIDTPRQGDMVAARMSLSDLTQFVGADSVQYLSYEGLITATGLPEDVFSTSCFTGIYPIDIGKRAHEVSRVIFQS